ncbi:MAG: glycosyltransferase family 2 protein [Armatimonadetes bacterium]|nr:glycosyltransferase family 2 protein [Armatimonadota bacterium]
MRWEEEKIFKNFKDIIVIMPDLSVIIVNWNAKDTLESCLNSLKEDLAGIKNEIFVVDNNSQDGSINLIKEKFHEVNLIENKENLGFSKANNQALRISKGEFILILNPDTFIFKGTIKKLINFIKINTHAGMVGPKIINQDGTLQLACRRSIPNPKVVFLKVLGLDKIFPKNPKLSQYNLTYLDENEIAKVEAVSGSCMLIRRKALEEVGLFDEDYFLYAEDLDWCYRFIKKGWEIYYYPSVKILHYKKVSSEKRRILSILNFYQAMYIFYRKHFLNKIFIFNWLIYFGIFLGALGSIGKGLLKGLLNKELKP